MTQASVQSQSQRFSLSRRQRLGVEMLGKSIPALREELYRLMDDNPCIEDIGQSIEEAKISDGERESERMEKERIDDWPDDDDYGESEYSADADAVERRRKFLESRTAEETLQEHLMKQIAVSDIDDATRPLAELLVGELDGNGYFAGSMPDLVMVTGESEEKILSTLAEIATLDPPGCASRTLSECLMAQRDKLVGVPGGRTAMRIIEKGLLEAVAAGDMKAIEKTLSVGSDECALAIKALRTLEPRPGRAYLSQGKGVEYINPEVHAVKSGDRWIATVDDRSLPEIRISKRYLAMLKDPSVDAEAKKYIRERISAAELVSDAIAHRRDTVQNIAQAIFDAQSGFFEGGLKALKPMSMSEIAAKTGFHETTVSRTVRDKYAATPKGTVELRRFFTGGFATADGGSVTRDAVGDAIREIVGGENPLNPLSDEAISKLLAAKGVEVARRTVAKYRGLLGIPSTAERRKKTESKEEKQCQEKE
jgi:RNA polymerase sigma-54 factor